MTTIVLTYRAVSRKISDVNIIPSINWKVFYGVALAVVLFLLIFYVHSVNSITQNSYLIQQHQKDINHLVQDNKSLEANFTRIDLLKQTVARARVLNLEKTGTITYIKIVNNSLAQVTQSEP